MGTRPVQKSLLGLEVPTDPQQQLGFLQELQRGQRRMMQHAADPAAEVAQNAQPAGRARWRRSKKCRCGKWSFCGSCRSSRGSTSAAPLAASATGAGARAACRAPPPPPAVNAPPTDSRGARSRRRADGGTPAAGVRGLRVGDRVRIRREVTEPVGRAGGSLRTTALALLWPTVRRRRRIACA